MGRPAALTEADWFELADQLATQEEKPTTPGLAKLAQERHGVTASYSTIQKALVAWRRLGGAERPRELSPQFMQMLVTGFTPMYQQLLAEARQAFEPRLAAAEAQVTAAAARVEVLRAELQALSAERDHLRGSLEASRAREAQLGADAAGTLTLHADRGSSMRSKPVADLLIDLQVAKTHSRPHVSDDNPYSESQFKTLKYRPDFPDRFGCIEDARVHCQQFFHWYNTAHRHTGIALMTPHTVHHGQAAVVTEERLVTLNAAFAATPNRFKHVAPTPPELPSAAWINPPKQSPPSPELAELIR
jgi:hypothetical protein